MSMLLSSLMEGAGATRGFIGGNFVDELPYLSLSEAAAELPCIIAESQLDILDDRSRVNDSIVEDAIRFRLEENATSNFGVIVETAASDLKDRIAKFFQRILKFIRSIIAKLKLQADNMTKSNKELWAKYSGQLQGTAAYGNMTINGYRFGRGAKFLEGMDASSKYVTSINGVMKLIEDAMARTGVRGVTHPNIFMQKLQAIAMQQATEQAWSGEVKTQFDETIDVLKGVTKAERSHAIICTLCGKELPKEGWETYFRQQAWGDKVALKYGEDIFSIDRIKDLMTNDKYIAGVRAEYEKLEAVIVRFEADLRSQLDSLERVGRANGSAVSQAYSTASAYYSAYISIVGDVFDAVSKLKNIKVVFYNDMTAQARRMFVALVNHKGGGAPADGGQNEDAVGEIEPAELLDFEL